MLEDCRLVRGEPIRNSGEKDRLGEHPVEKDLQFENLDEKDQLFEYLLLVFREP